MIPQLLEANWEAQVEQPSSSERHVSARLHHLTHDLDQALVLTAPFLPPGLPQHAGGQMQLRDLDINAVVESMASMVRRILGEDVELELACASVPLGVQADTGMMEQVILNLVVNARDAMPSGGRLRIETSPRQCRKKSDRLWTSIRPPLEKSGRAPVPS